MSRMRRLWSLVFVLVVYLAAASPSLTGLAAHEWIGLAAVVALLAHAAMHAGRFLRGRFARAHGAKADDMRGRMVLDALLLAALAACFVSGVMVSAEVLPSLGLYATGYYFWDPLHAVSAKLLLALLLIHFALNWRAIGAMLPKRRGDHERRWL